MIQFRVATLLWVMVVAASFFVGRYSALPKVSTTSGIATSATWNPGNSATFAIAGPVDIDGDGSDDLTMLTNLISKTGGIVVASQNSNGAISGKIDAATRYLVVQSPSDPKMAVNKLVMDANKLSVPLISVEKLLKRLGVQHEKLANGFQAREN